MLAVALLLIDDNGRRGPDYDYCRSYGEPRGGPPLSESEAAAEWSGQYPEDD
jgi:hypothetical protein